MQDTMVFVDRDGTINRIFGDGPIYDITRFELLPRAALAIAALNAAKVRVALATNQGGIGHRDREFSWEQYRAIERKMQEQLFEEAHARLDAVFVCPHADYERCRCRKPETGMFEDAKQQFSIAPERSYIIGDSDADIVAGRRFGMRTIWVRSGNMLHRGEGGVEPDFIAEDLFAAVELVLTDISAAAGSDGAR